MMNHTTILRVLGFIGGGVLLASAGLAAGMALAPAQQAAIVVEPLSTMTLAPSADLRSSNAVTATPLPPPANNAPVTSSSTATPQPNGWPGAYGGWTGGMTNDDWDQWGIRPGTSAQYNATPGYGMHGDWEMQGGMMNDDWGMDGYMGGYGNGYAPQAFPATAQPIASLDVAAQSVRAYLANVNNPDLALVEVIQFGDGFYARIREQSTGRYAFAVLVDPNTGQVWPEPGPNVVWNTRYGQGAHGNMTLTSQQANQLAQASLDTYVPGATAGDPLTFYGYYTFEVRQANQIIGMVSVNGITGEVWYHNQYGPYLDRLMVTP